MNSEIQKYSKFVSEVLQERLKEALKIRNDIEKDINEFNNLLELINDFMAAENKKKEKVLVDLGNKFHMKAVIPDTSTIIIDIGLSFYLEMPLKEASENIHKRLKDLERKYNINDKKSKEIASHIEKILYSIQKLAQLNKLKENGTF